MSEPTYITVDRADFLADPAKYAAMAGPDTVVRVRNNTGKVAVWLGGSLGCRVWLGGSLGCRNDDPDDLREQLAAVTAERDRARAMLAARIIDDRPLTEKEIAYGERLISKRFEGTGLKPCIES